MTRFLTITALSIMAAILTACGGGDDQDQQNQSCMSFDGKTVQCVKSNGG